MADFLNWSIAMKKPHMPAKAAPMPKGKNMLAPPKDAKAMPKKAMAMPFAKKAK